MQIRYAMPILTLAAMLVLLAVGCSDDVSNPSPEPGDSGLQVFLIDSPGDYEEVNIEVLEVRVHRNETDTLAGWHTINSDTIRTDLLTLRNGVREVLADTVLGAGYYTQMRLVLSEDNTVKVDGEIHHLEVPRGSESGLKLNHPFELEDGKLYRLTLDFDAERSIHRTGSDRYTLHPVIRVIANDVGGSLRGAVEPVDARARVMAMAGDDSLVAYADTLTGEFLFPLLEAGDYDVEISATAGAYSDTLLAQVAVAAGQQTDLGVITLEAVVAED